MELRARNTREILKRSLGMDDTAVSVTLPHFEFSVETAVTADYCT
jgi:hypothetical protein